MSKKKFSKLLEDWSIRSSLDGLPNIVSSRNHVPSLVYWLIMFSICLALSIYMVVSLVIEYNNYEVVSSDRLVPYDELKFPLVTFCNENPFLSSQANEYLRGYFFEKYGVNVSSYKQILELLGPNQLKLDAKRALYNLMSPNVSDEMRKSMGYSPEDTFLSIYYFDKPFLNYSEIAEWFFDPVYGNCYRIKSSNAYREGLGLWVEIFTGLSYDLHSYIYEPSAKGIRIEIKDADNYPYVHKSVLIQSNMVNLFTFTKRVRKLLPRPYSKCDSISLQNVPLVDEMESQGIPYDRSLCYIFALQNWTINNYGCHNLLYPRMSFDSSSPPCFNESLPSSVYVDTSECPLDCDQISYDFFFSDAAYPTESWYVDYLFQNREYFERVFGHVPSFESIKSSFAMVIIVFEKLVIEEVSEKPKVEFLDLIANIGGTIGLFIGLSVLTLTEIFDLLFDFIGIQILSSRKVYQINETLEKSRVNESVDSYKLVQLKRFRLKNNN